jgi:nitroreductase
MPSREPIDAEALLEMMKARRSIRLYRPDAPSREAVERLVEAAIAAPSAANRQPWRFLAIADRTVLAGLAAAVREEVENLARRAPGGAGPVLSEYAKQFAWFEKAPLVLAVLYRPAQTLADLAGGTVPEDLCRTLSDMERDSALIGASLALQNLLLMAHAMGLGACVMTGPALAHDRACRLLAVPSLWRILALVPTGLPDEVPPAPPRRPASQVLRWIA